MGGVGSRPPSWLASGPVSVSSAMAASALASTWEHLVAAIPDGWTRREGGIVGAVTGVAIPTLNGVWPEQVEVKELDVTKMLDAVAKTGLPHCLQLRPGTPQDLSVMAEARGMIPQEPEPLMVLEDPRSLDAALAVRRLRIRQLDPADVSLHATTAARGFGAPEELFHQLMTPAVVGRPGVRCYIGELDGCAVTTGLGVTLGDFVGIFNIATDPDHRGQGFGAAVTARAVIDGMNDSATWSYLQSSPSGYGVYLRLGFTVLEQWSCWVSPT